MNEKAKQKNTKIKNFQVSILKCFLDNFPNLKYLIYSTCSIFPSENEEVVKQIIESVNDDNTNKRSIELVDVSQNSGFDNGFNDDVLKLFLDGTSMGGVSCEKTLRAFPFKKEHDGFFVALFKINRESLDESSDVLDNDKQ
jgi:16S rRNA C967 or C1407 C5-methylase (RsmB/RsmF family)